MVKLFGINNNRWYKLGILVGLIIFVITLESGCIGIQRSNLTVAIPESGLDTTIGKQESLQVTLIPLEADAKEVVINVSAPPGISLTDEHPFFMKYSNELKTIAKDQKIIIPFNFSAISDGSFNLTVEVNASNANSTIFNYTVNAYIPTPSLEIGEFWVYNQTKGNAQGLHVVEVVRKDVSEGKEYYVMKGTWEGEPKGTYSLSYYSVDTYSSKMNEFYEDDQLMKEKNTEIDPPSSDYGFPFRVGKKWSWSGSVTGIGKSEMNGEIVKKETITVPGGTYNSYYIRQKMSFSMATGVGEIWYVPELNGFAKYRMSTNALGVTSEDEIELIEHGKKPSEPRKVQSDIQIPEGYKLYKNDKFNFRLAYPKNWKFDSTEDGFASYFTFEDSSIYTVLVTIEPIGKLNLIEYRDLRAGITFKNLPGSKISQEKKVTVNGREGYEWVYDIPSLNAKTKQVVFVAEGNGYLLSGYSLGTVYNSYEPMFDNIINSFFIKGNPNKYILS